MEKQMVVKELLFTHILWAKSKKNREKMFRGKIRKKMIRDKMGKTMEKIGKKNIYGQNQKKKNDSTKKIGQGKNEKKKLVIKQLLFTHILGAKLEKK